MSCQKIYVACQKEALKLFSKCTKKKKRNVVYGFENCAQGVLKYIGSMWYLNAAILLAPGFGSSALACPLLIMRTLLWSLWHSHESCVFAVQSMCVCDSVCVWSLSDLLYTISHYQELDIRIIFVFVGYQRQLLCVLHSVFWIQTYRTCWHINVSLRGAWGRGLILISVTNRNRVEPYNGLH